MLQWTLIFLIVATHRGGVGVRYRLAGDTAPVKSPASCSSSLSFSSWYR